MKLKIKVKRLSGTIKLPRIIEKGDWIDLTSAKEVEINAPTAGTLRGKESTKRDVTSEVVYVPLGVAIQLPKGFEAIVAPRSSTAKNVGVIMANSIGIIDNTYCGNNDQWHFPAIGIRKTVIPINTRLCQFRIQLSQKANMIQKLKWILSSGIELEEVDNLKSVDRKGFGKGTGK